jgi:hypothetical protein
MKKAINFLFGLIGRKKKKKEAQKEALAQIGYMVVSAMSDRTFRRLIQRNKRLYAMIVSVMENANQNNHD